MDDIVRTFNEETQTDNNGWGQGNSGEDTVGSNENGVMDFVL